MVESYDLIVRAGNLTHTFCEAIKLFFSIFAPLTTTYVAEFQLELVSTTAANIMDTDVTP